MLSVNMFIFATNPSVNSSALIMWWLAWFRGCAIIFRSTYLLHIQALFIVFEGHIMCV